MQQRTVIEAINRIVELELDIYRNKERNNLPTDGSPESERDAEKRNIASRESIAEIRAIKWMLGGELEWHR